MHINIISLNFTKLPSYSNISTAIIKPKRNLLHFIWLPPLLHKNQLIEILYFESSYHRLKCAGTTHGGDEPCIHISSQEDCKGERERDVEYIGADKGKYASMLN
jgi:hypothetical protein